MRFAQREFAGDGDGVARVMAMLEWIHRNVDYVTGVSNTETTAERTFVDRAGVCRDFTHLGITFARALGIPARAVILVAESGGPTMLARIGVLRALNRNVERVFNPDRKNHHWGKRVLKRDK